MQHQSASTPGPTHKSLLEPRHQLSPSGHPIWDRSHLRAFQQAVFGACQGSFQWRVMLCPSCRFLVFAPLTVEPVPVVRHVSEHYHFPATNEGGMRRSHTHNGNLSIHITTSCSKCGHSFSQDYQSQDVCRACHREQRRAKVRQEILVEELAAQRIRDKKKADTDAKQREEMEAKAKADAMKLKEDAARHAAEQEALRKLAEETARQQAELEAAKKRAEEKAARQWAEREEALNLAEEIQKKLAREEAARKLVAAEAARKYAEEVAATQRAKEEAEKKKQEAERLAAIQRAEEELKKKEEAERLARERQYIYDQYIASQQAELDRLKSQAAAKAAAQEEHSKRVQEELDRLKKDEESRKKAEEEVARQAAFALAEQHRLQEQARLNKEYRDRLAEEHQKREAERLAAEKAHADFVLAQSQELSRIEADKKLRAYYEQIEEEKERALIREEVKKEIANRGSGTIDHEELLRRLNALKTDDKPPVPPPHKTTHKVNLRWESGCKGGH
ncbi:hypothetical protein K440DRAFT_664752 [Wilcoxina mikolae CBS 423.85]|nr:hypothetical protein K440DRAFT_664752 [Wilcoxina mikolae CBS 423.85]